MPSTRLCPTCSRRAGACSSDLRVTERHRRRRIHTDPPPSSLHHMHCRDSRGHSPPPPRAPAICWAPGTVCWAAGTVCRAAGTVCWAAGTVCWAAGTVCWAAEDVEWAVAEIDWAVRPPPQLVRHRGTGSPARCCRRALPVVTRSLRRRRVGPQGPNRRSLLPNRCWWGPPGVTGCGDTGPCGVRMAAMRSYDGAACEWSPPRSVRHRTTGSPARWCGRTRHAVASSAHRGRAGSGGASEPFGPHRPPCGSWCTTDGSGWPTNGGAWALSATRDRRGGRRR